MSMSAELNGFCYTPQSDINAQLRLTHKQYINNLLFAFILFS